MTVAVVLVGGEVPERSLLHGVAEADLVIAVDSGVGIARTYGLPVHVLLGDLDSVSPGDQAWAEAEGASTIEFPTNKDATDLELAIDHAIDEGADDIIALGIEGGRLDHELGNWAVLCRPRTVRMEIRAAMGVAIPLHGEHHPSIELNGKPGEIISLLPLLGDACGVTTSGLRWTLDAATVPAGSAWGISNEFAEDVAFVSVDSGTLLVIRPNAGVS